MKGFLVSVMLCIAGYSQAQSFDQKLADSLGADGYGMKSYVLAILKSGTNTTTDKKITDSLFRGHMNNINRLAKENKLLIAGPLQKNDKTYRGIFILNVKTVEEAQTLVNTDPAISSGLLAVELYGWYGSAALPMYLPYADKVTKQHF